MSKKRGTYYKYLSWVKDDAEYSMLTQLYEFGGIYCVINHGNQHDQWASEPKFVEKGQREMIADLEKKGIEVRLGPQITVDKDPVTGYWMEIIDE